VAPPVSIGRGGPAESAALGPRPDAAEVVVCNEMAAQHWDVLYRTALRLTGRPQEAEALVQETCRRARRSLHTYQPGSHPKAWLIRILHHAHLDRLQALSHTLGIPLSRLCRGRRAMRRLLMRYGLQATGPRTADV
jgi:sigma-70-like protein